MTATSTMTKPFSLTKKKSYLGASIDPALSERRFSLEANDFPNGVIEFADTKTTPGLDDIIQTASQRPQVEDDYYN